jgi:hypothetical protein
MTCFVYIAKYKNLTFLLFVLKILILILTVICVCIYIMANSGRKEVRDKKDDKPSNKNSDEMPSLKDYKSKEE